MLYAIRNEQGQITSLSTHPVGNSTVADIADPEVAHFLSSNSEASSPQEFLEKSDSEVSRIIEDLIDLLISKNTILFTDLPEAAQQKLLTRKLARSAYDNEPAKPSMGNFILTDDDTI
ncbi:hypothetical protein [Amphritea japonica]|uniref:Tryptophan synthase subunit beta like protein n=1 Tax=Amphritea japonica ATCC BAA-1530 TaxID=1278309 RepID=A0A7R6PPN1_9GAMM|nr:hypothetical protein [Amphritea japonica]BBB27208.1 conserved hypothetical protein [Amphritea japonica ATCC BAA-1530]